MTRLGLTLPSWPRHQYRDAASWRSRAPMEATRSGDPHRHVDRGRGCRQTQNHRSDRRHVVFRRCFEAVPREIPAAIGCESARRRITDCFEFVDLQECQPGLTRGIRRCREGPDGGGVNRCSERTYMARPRPVRPSVGVSKASRTESKMLFQRTGCFRKVEIETASKFGGPMYTNKMLKQALTRAPGVSAVNHVRLAPVLSSSDQVVGDLAHRNHSRAHDRYRPRNDW